MLNRDLVSEADSTWDEGKIRNRTERMVDSALTCGAFPKDISQNIALTLLIAQRTIESLTSSRPECWKAESPFTQDQQSTRADGNHSFTMAE